MNRGKGKSFKCNVDFPYNLFLQQFILCQESISSYELKGVITHLGESGASGHFVASCKSPCDNHWYRYNDAIVNPINDVQTEIINFGMPYILFYKKRE